MSKHVAIALVAAYKLMSLYQFVIGDFEKATYGVAVAIFWLVIALAFHNKEQEKDK